MPASANSLHTSQNRDVGQTYTKRRNRLAMRLQIRYRTRNQLGTINRPSGRLQTSLYHADGGWVGQGVLNVACYI